MADTLFLSPVISISRYRKIIEVRDAISLRPEAGSASLRESPVFRFKDLRSVEKHAELSVLENDTKVVPLALGDVILDPVRARWHPLRGNREAHTILHFVQ